MTEGRPHLTGRVPDPGVTMENETQSVSWGAAFHRENKTWKQIGKRDPHPCHVAPFQLVSLKCLTLRICSSIP